MGKNITFSADETLIQRAREVARREGKSLNIAFREWLKNYARRDHMLADYQKLMTRLNYAESGRKFTRDEMNER